MQVEEELFAKEVRKHAKLGGSNGEADTKQTDPAETACGSFTTTTSYSSYYVTKLLAPLLATSYPQFRPS